jgi:hypothetical protein
VAEDDEFGLGNDPPVERTEDAREVDVTTRLRGFFESNREQVFFSRQLEVQNEDDYFHWITNRAIRSLREEGLIKGETRTLSSTGGKINLVWHNAYRFYRRNASRLVKLVDEYADPNIGAALGLHGEMMVLEGFARFQFVMRGRETREFADRSWTSTDHNLDFIFELDGQPYGVEVKNTLGYMDYEEFKTKIVICRFLGIRPIFAARMLPKTWIAELVEAGGYAMVLKHQLYPWTHKALARRVARELGLPIDAPRALYDGTMHRLIAWHRKNL